MIDGGSNDGTVELLASNRQHFAYCLSEPDRGIYHAWNKALSQVKGEWICFLGADDFLWDDTVLSKMAARLQILPASVRVAYGRIMMLDAAGSPLYELGKPWQDIKNRFKNAMCIPHPGVMHRRSLFDEHGQFDESFRIAADYELLLRELPMADAAFVPDVTAVGMRQGGISSVAGNLWLALAEIRKAQSMHGYAPPWTVRSTAVLSVWLRVLMAKLLGEASTRKLINWSKRKSLR